MMTALSILQIKVSISGRQLETFRFTTEEVSIGRDANATVFLDNLGVSRLHAKIEPTATGFRVTDLKSSNGTFLNDQPVQQSDLKDGDLLQIGKFTLAIGITEEHPAVAQVEPAESLADDGEGTVFLQPAENARVIAESREAERPVAPQRVQSRPQVQHPPATGDDSLQFGTVMKIFLLGAAFAWLCIWLLD